MKMKTKVKIKRDCEFTNMRCKAGEEGYIDGYFPCESHAEAIVVIGNRVISVWLDNIEVID